MTPMEPLNTNAPDAGVEHELGELAYIIAHDLGAVLRQLKGVVDLILRDLEPTKVERHQVLLKHLDAASKNGQEMISALSAYSSVQVHDLRRETYTAEDLVNEALRELGSTIEASGAEIVVDPLGSILVDRALFVEALKRLMGNAIHFGRPGVAPRIRISRRPDDRDWVVWIADSGIGLDVDQHERVFQMFYRQRPRDAHARAGAGLTIARRIFRRHGGELRFIDQTQGACIEMRLPQPVVG